MWQGSPSMKSGGSGQGLCLSAHLTIGAIKYFFNLRSCSDFSNIKTQKPNKPPANVLSAVPRAPL